MYAYGKDNRLHNQHTCTGNSLNEFKKILVGFTTASICGECVEILGRNTFYSTRRCCWALI